MQGEQIATATRRQLATVLTAVVCLVGLILAPVHANADGLHHHAHKHLLRGSVAVVATVDNAGLHARGDVDATGQSEDVDAVRLRTPATNHAGVGDAGRTVVTPQGRGPPRHAS